MRLLMSKNVVVGEIETSGIPGLREWLREVTGRATLPQIFINGHHVGGYDDLAALERSGQLDRLFDEPRRDNPSMPPRT
jgi:glutaredoxin 3